MGKASGTNQHNVVKPKIQHVVGDGTGASFGGETSTQPTSVNACLFSVELKIKNSPSEGDRQFKKGDSVTLVRVTSDDLGIFVANRRISSYTGQLKSQLLECMAKGYVYAGKVENVGANTLRAIVRGGVLSHATA
tara:strand:+ start:12844 stop:13248 length:405 start_codon:yes stop_codon:yes gene_type:complete